MADARRPDYGIDAPQVVRNLAVAGGALLAVGVLTLLGILPREIVIPPGAKEGLRIGLLGMWLGAGGGFTLGAIWMWWGSRYGKLRERERLLDRIPWRGDERVLDVGCGRGLVLVGAAKRVPSGSAVGIDLWQEEDLSGNRPEVPIQNAALEGVAPRVSVQTADMRKIPFPEDTFDVIVSRAAIHNLYKEADRVTAIQEIARVLAPGGRAVISDIRHLREYARTFETSGCRDVTFLDSWILSAIFGIVTFGAMRPNTLLVRKDAEAA